MSAGMTLPHTLLPIAREAQHMARNAGAGESVLFQKVAAVAVCIVAVSSGMHVLNELYRMLHPEERHRFRGR